MSSTGWFFLLMYLGAGAITFVLSWVVFIFDGQGAIFLEDRRTITKYLVCTSVLWPIAWGAAIKLMIEEDY